METISRAIIIAAGEGKRLRPVTETTPKPLVEVNGTRIIDTSIKALKDKGIHDIYIVTGYKKEQFYKAYESDPDIHILENPYYMEGNNITSMYVAREYLPGAFVIEGDIMVKNNRLFNVEISQSTYCGKWHEHTPEWAARVNEGRIISCSTKGADNSFQIWGISKWTQDDGYHLSELIRKQFEEIKDWSIYWDEIALIQHVNEFDIGICEITKADLIEIDTVQELADIDSTYEKYCN